MKRYRFIISIFVILILATSIFFHVSKKDIKLDNVEIKKDVKNNMFAMYKKVNGNYVEITDNVFPTEGYVLNTTDSKCIDNNGNVVPNILSYNDTTKKVVVDTDKSVFCYLYFDTFEYTITLIMNDGTFSSTPSGWTKSGNNYTRSYNIETNTFSLPNNPTKNGYYFDGWYTNSSLTGTGVTNIAKGTIGSKTYYAKWNSSKYYLVNNGIEMLQSQQANINSVTYEDGYIQVTTKSTTNRANYYFENINLDNYSQLCVDISITNFPSSSDTSSKFLLVIMSNISGSAISTINIKGNGGTLARQTKCGSISINGSYIITLLKNANSNNTRIIYNIYNLWLE